jgi:hypothetical protein
MYIRFVQNNFERKKLNVEATRGDVTGVDFSNILRRKNFVQRPRHLASSTNIIGSSRSDLRVGM